jgi:hypothetical protein
MFNDPEDFYRVPRVLELSKKGISVALIIFTTRSQQAPARFDLTDNHSFFSSFFFAANGFNAQRINLPKRSINIF